MARLHDIKKDDMENTYWGIATSLWFNHCPHRCPGCWNEETWDLDEDLEIDNDEVIEKTLRYLDNNGVDRSLTLLGGEPFSHYNLDDLDYMLSSIKSSRPNTRVLAWSGYEFHVLKSSPRFLNIIKNIDVLVCGRFMEEYKSKDTTKMYGSENQYIVDVKKSLSTGQTVYIEKGEQFLGLEEMRAKMKKRSSS